MTGSSPTELHGTQSGWNGNTSGNAAAYGQKRNLSPARYYENQQAQGRSSPQADTYGRQREPDMSRFALAAEQRAEEINRLANKAEMLGQQVASLRNGYTSPRQNGQYHDKRQYTSPYKSPVQTRQHTSPRVAAPSQRYQPPQNSPQLIRFPRGTRVRAAAELTVRGIQAVAVNDTGTVHGPSDDPSLVEGINIQWDKRRDGGTRRINVLPTDIEPLASASPLPYQPIRGTPHNGYTNASPVDAYRASPQRYARVGSSFDGMNGSPMVPSSEREGSPTRRPNAGPDPVYAPHLGFQQMQAAEVQQREWPELRSYHETQIVNATMPSPPVQSAATSRPQPATPQQSPVTPGSVSSKASENMEELQQRKRDELRRLASIQGKRRVEEEKAKSASDAVKSEEERLRGLTQRIRDEEERLEHLRKQAQAMSAAPPGPALFVPRKDSRGSTSSRTLSKASQPCDTPSNLSRKSSQHVDDHFGGLEIRMEDSIIERHHPEVFNTTPKGQILGVTPSGSRVTFGYSKDGGYGSGATAPQHDDEERPVNRHHRTIELLQGGWSDASGNKWVVRDLDATVERRSGGTETFVVRFHNKSVLVNDVAIDNVSADGRFILWSDGQRWDRVGIRDSVSLHPTSSIMSQGDDAQPAVWMSRKTSLKITKTMSNAGLQETQKSLLSRKGSLGIMLASLAERPGVVEDPLVDEEAVWWQVPRVDVSSVSFIHPHHGDPPGATSSPPIGAIISFTITGTPPQLHLTYNDAKQPPVTRVTLERTEHGVFLLFPDEASGPVPDRVVCLPPDDMAEIIAGVICLSEKTNVKQNLNYEYEALANQEAIIERFLQSNGRVPWSFVNALLPPNYIAEPASNAAAVAALIAVVACYKEANARVCAVM
ncbi:hypothetical protein DIPPA_17662 [Diplonema papillatum]|nr:hypothetical protein DIPPA_17662 [Diplonema papillatum]KAJ9466634.1 hypothetical protein DIPPA_17662 [Diplonema papillatum]